MAAFVIRGDDSVDQLDASSFPVGMMEEVAYEEGTVELAPGDMLLAYSDGLTEATNLAGEEYGVERVRALLPQLRLLSPERVGARILREVDRFLGEARPTDDLSLIVVVKQ